MQTRIIETLVNQKLYSYGNYNQGGPLNAQTAKIITPCYRWWSMIILILPSLVIIKAWHSCKQIRGQNNAALKNILEWTTWILPEVRLLFCWLSWALFLSLDVEVERVPRELLRLEFPWEPLSLHEGLVIVGHLFPLLNGEGNL